MKLTKKENSFKMSWKNIKIGSCFMLNNDCYIKVDDSSTDQQFYNTLRLLDGLKCKMYEENVIPITIEEIIYMEYSRT